MEKLEHPLWIVDAANRIFGPAVNALLGLFGMHAADRRTRSRTTW